MRFVNPALLVSLTLLLPGGFQDRAMEEEYLLADGIPIQLSKIESDWVFNLGDELASVPAHLTPIGWSVPDLGMELVRARVDDVPGLLVQRYGEEVFAPSVEVDPATLEPAGGLRSRTEDLVPRLMIALSVPGVSIAILDSHEIAWLRSFGQKAAGNPEGVDENTVFEGASLSKPVFAYVVLKLAEETLLDLDTPLVEILGTSYPQADPSHTRITARMVLTHTTGFPNWREGGWREGGPIRALFEPGTGFGYSGEGFLFLQRVVESRMGLPADRLAESLLFDPLGMSSTSYVWRESYGELGAEGHDRWGQVSYDTRPRYEEPNVAFTLYTTPHDYALFLLEIMRVERNAPHSLSAESVQAMLTPRVLVPDRQPLLRRGGPEQGASYFGLGWRIDVTPSGAHYYHGGSNGTGFRCYAEFDPDTGRGIVIMTNAANGIDLWGRLLALW